MEGLSSLNIRISLSLSLLLAYDHVETCNDVRTGSNSANKGTRKKVAEMGMLRWSLGLMRKDRVRNDQVREITKVAPLHEKLRGKIAVVWACTTKRPDLCGEESGGVGGGPTKAGKTKEENER